MITNNKLKGCTVDIDTASNIGICAGNITNGTTEYDNTAEDFFGGISADPKMADPANGDFSITTASPAYGAAVDAGTLTEVTV
jgi:hypothetical protein